MLRSVMLVLGLAGLGLLVATPNVGSQESSRGEPAQLRVQLPKDAQLIVDGAVTKQAGEVRRFVSPPLPAGQRFVYTLKATWKDAEGIDKVTERVARVQAGQETAVDLRFEASTAAPQDKDRQPDVIYVPTHQKVVEKMLEIAKVKKDDIVMDLGCGDGRIPVTAATKYGCKAYGYDIDPERIKESLENVKKNNVEKLVTIEKKDIFALDLSKADVVTLYLLPDLNVKLMPQLMKLKEGSRIVSHDFDMRGAKPKEVIKFTPPGEGEREHTIYFWTVPWEKD